MASPSVDTCDVYGCSHIVVKYFITVSTVKQWTTSCDKYNYHDGNQELSEISWCSMI